MAGKLGKTTNWVDDAIDAKIADWQLNQWGTIPGQVVSFNSQNQTATIKPLYKPKFNGQAVEMPELLEVPVRFARAGGGSALTFPVKQGDKIRLSPSMRSTENYLTEDDGSPSDARSFNLSDMEAYLDGGESLTDPIQNFDSQNMHLRGNATGTFGIKMSPDGKVAIEGAEGNIYELIAEFMELVASDSLMINYGSSQGTGHRLFNRDALLVIAGKIRAMAL